MGTLIRLIWRIFLAYLLIIVLCIFIFRWASIPTTAFMMAHQVELWQAADSTPIQYHWVDYEDINPYLSLAVIASEDQRFGEHRGVDVGATSHAIEQALDGKSAGGGSTITQQVAKNLFLWSGRSYARKVLEWGIAGLLELFWTKRRILEVYLNIAQFGERTYGVGAAAEKILKRSPAKISFTQAAAMAAVLPSPAKYSIVKPSDYVMKRRRHIKRQMRLMGGVKYLEFLNRK